jgi:hypothetical protein
MGVTNTAGKAGCRIATWVDVVCVCVCVCGACCAVLQVLLRGCLLANTPWVIGLVMYAGPDTRIQVGLG